MTERYWGTLARGNVVISHCVMKSEEEEEATQGLSNNAGKDKNILYFLQSSHFRFNLLVISCCHRGQTNHCGLEEGAEPEEKERQTDRDEAR